MAIPASLESGRVEQPNSSRDMGGSKISRRRSWVHGGNLPYYSRSWPFFGPMRQFFETSMSSRGGGRRTNLPSGANASALPNSLPEPSTRLRASETEIGCWMPSKLDLEQDE